MTNPGRVETARLPIKVILPNQGVDRPILGGGGKKKPFQAVTQDFRRSLGTQIEALGVAVREQARQAGSAPIRVQLVKKAVAKTHRPKRLFSPKSCPIV